MFGLNEYQYFEDVNLGLLKYMPSHASVLDVGCGNGLLGQLYAEKDNTVVGIDSAREVEAVCKKRLATFFLADITDFGKVRQLMKNRRFDIIIFADVLEHLADPVSTVLFYKQFLKPNGQMYISLPNIAVWYVRLSLLLGNFNYTETGVLDKTHLRFFTKKTILRLLEHTGMTLVTMDFTPGIAIVLDPFIRRMFMKEHAITNRRAIIDSPLYRMYVKYVYPLEYWCCKLNARLFAFKFITIAKMTARS